MRRRDALRGVLATGVAWGLAACGARPPATGKEPEGGSTGPSDQGPDSAAPDTAARGDTAEPADCSVTPGSPNEGWVEVPLAAHPALLEPGGWVTLAIPESLLYIVVACTAPDCWVALWSTCTHGACGIQWDAATTQAWCPCHGSRFAPSGLVIHGPAERPLTAFPVGRRGDSLWVHRPL